MSVNPKVSQRYTRMHTLQGKGHEFTIEFPDNWEVLPAGFFGRFLGKVVSYKNPDNRIVGCIFAGRRVGVDALVETERFFRFRTPPNNIIKIEPVSVNGGKHFAAVYTTRFGMISKGCWVVYSGQ